jgi:phosphatidylglycerophosphate synthase
MTRPTSPTPGPASPAASHPAKPGEVEEWVDEAIHRPLARLLVRGLARTPITPNQVTLLSALVGVAAGLALVRGVERPLWRLIAGLLLFFSVVLDCSDGQLARAKGISSTYGAIMDGIADYVVGVAIGLAGSWYMVQVNGSAWFWLLGLAGIASAAAHAALFDHTKTRYIARAGGGYREREEDLDAVRADRARARREGRWRDVVLLWLYENYSRAQHAALQIPAAADPSAFRARYGGRMRRWTWLGIGTHFALAYLLLVLGVWWPAAPTFFFLVSATVLNLFLVSLLVEERWVGSA